MIRDTKLKPGWFKRQMETSKASIATWPSCFLPLLSINEELKRNPLALTATIEDKEQKLNQYNHEISDCFEPMDDSET